MTYCWTFLSRTNRITRLIYWSFDQTNLILCFGTWRTYFGTCDQTKIVWFYDERLVDYFCIRAICCHIWSIKKYQQFRLNMSWNQRYFFKHQKKDVWADEWHEKVDNLGGGGLKGQNEFVVSAGRWLRHQTMIGDWMLPTRHLLFFFLTLVCMLTNLPQYFHFIVTHPSFIGTTEQKLFAQLLKRINRFYAGKDSHIKRLAVTIYHKIWRFLCKCW